MDGGEPSVTVIVLAATTGGPIGLAEVALDVGGDRYAGTTGMDGRVVFQGVDSHNAEMDVTAVSPGYRAVSRVDVRNEDPIELRAFLRTPVIPSAWVQGEALGMVDTANNLVVTATAGFTRMVAGAPGYQVEVATGIPFALIAKESELVAWGARGYTRSVFQWAVRSRAAISEDVFIDLDFEEDAASPTRFSGAFILPPYDDSPMRTASVGDVLVQGLGWNMLAGYSDDAWPSVDGDRIVYEGEYVTLPEDLDVEVCTKYGLSYLHDYVDDSGEFHSVPVESVVTALGYPDGVGAFEFYDSPVVTSPLTLHPLPEPIEWTSNDRGSHMLLQISGEHGPAWDVIAPPDAESLTVPELPAAVIDELLGVPAWQGRVGVCDFDEVVECKRVGWSAPVELVP